MRDLYARFVVWLIRPAVRQAVLDDLRRNGPICRAASAAVAGREHHYGWRQE